MNQITEDYCSFETAKLLKEKRFDGECSRFYMPSGNGRWKYGHYHDFDISERIDCPTHQMALKWLRKVHKLHISVFIGSDESYDANGVTIDEWHFWTYCITNTSGDMVYDAYNKVNVIEYQTCEEAVEAAIKYCLENLI